MARVGKQKRGQRLEAKRKAAPPSPPPPKRTRLRLGTVRDVRREMARLYFEMRAGRIEAAKGTKLAYVLSSVGKMVEMETFEERFQALEERIRVGS